MEHDQEGLTLLPVPPIRQGRRKRVCVVKAVGAAAMGHV